MTDEMRKDTPREKTSGASASPALFVSEGGRREGPRRKNVRRNKRDGRRERVRPEFDHRVIDIRRVARVVAGGRRFSFSVTLVAGDRNGRVGVGVAKAGDTAAAIDKAMRSAKKNMIVVARTHTNSIAHETEAKYASAIIHVFPAPARGLVAGGAARSVLELGGIHDVGAKMLSRSKNNINNARATIKALLKLSHPVVLNRLNGKKIRDGKEY